MKNKKKQNKKNILSERKSDHLKLASLSQWENSNTPLSDWGLTYEPCLGRFPEENFSLQQSIGNKLIKHPLWISSMTGGSSQSGKINRILAKVAREWRLGMGLGSCRIILDQPKMIKDFKLRSILNENPFWANLGICQIDELLRKKSWNSFQNILDELEVDGLIIHVNPTQEYLQPYGSSVLRPPLDVLKEFLQVHSQLPVIVKEVGQGIGPKSLKALSQLKLTGLELGALGGTNFASLELMRSPIKGFNSNPLNCLTKLGHSAKEMVDFWTNIQTDHVTKHLKSWHVIISGGRGHDVISDFVLFKKVQKTQSSSIGLGYSILEQCYQGEKVALEWIRRYLKAFYYLHNFTQLKDT